MTTAGQLGRILVVDDSITVRMDLSESLQEAGFDVDMAASLAEAREQLKRLDHRLILLDVQLPDGDGVDFLAELRAMPEGARLRVILMSTEAQVRDRLRGMEQAADDYVGKPYATSYLVARAADLLRQAAGHAPSSGPVVLLADDSATHRHHLRDLLVQNGFHVLLASTGEEALATARRELPDLLILDVVLPGLSGFQTLRRLRMDTALRSVPVVMLTGADGAGDELAGLESGADAYVRKGEDFQVLHARLQALLRVTRTREAREATESSTQKVLLIDPDPVAQARVSEQLREDSYDTVMVSSGEEALQILPVQGIDAILMDRVLPGLSASELCTQIKAHPEWRHIPVLMRAAEDRPQTLLDSLAAGADDFLPRSAGVNVLRARLRAQLRRKHYEDENRRVLFNRSREEIAAADVLSARSLADTRARHVQELQAKNEELDIARAAAEEATRAKALFLATMSHEIRTPMNAIIGITDLLGDTRLDSGQREFVDIIRGSGRHLLSVINDILDFTKIESEKLELEEVPFALRECVAQAIDLVDHKAREKKLVLRCQFEPGTPDVIVGDAVRIRQILVNYLSNAVKFTAAGEVVIGVSVVAQQGDVCELRFDVQDTGPGIDPEHLGKLFRSFTQVDASTTRLHGGTGLGLAICKRLAELMHGSVGVRSTPGVGSTFHFTIQTRIAALAAGRTQAPVVAPPVLTGASDLRILLVEDTAANQTVARLMLASLGYRNIDIVGNGQLAVLACMAQPFQLVLMDVQMPVMDGLEATRMIRAQHFAWPQPKIVAMTANAFKSDRDNCLAAGMDDYIAKPIERARLAQVLGTVTAPVVAREAGAAQATWQHVDGANLRDMQASMGEDGAIEVVESIVSDAPRLLGGLRSSLAALDRKALRRFSHSIRSMCSMVGARGNAGQCDELERHVDTGTTDELGRLSALVEDSYHAVVEELQRWQRQAQTQTTS